MARELKNTFSWSVSRHRIFSECRRAYYYRHYGFWGGWDVESDPRIREIYVLKSLGLGDELAHSSIRFSLGRFTTDEEVDFAADRVITEVKRLREMSPLWEMVQDGVDLSQVKWTMH